nr:MAG TPA: hypothetical protein [Caudoviricetes sp.]
MSCGALSCGALSCGALSYGSIITLLFTRSQQWQKINFRRKRNTGSACMGRKN